jgi:hypothetical protein
MSDRAQFYEVRLHLKAGTQLSYHYRDPAQAELVRKTVAKGIETARASKPAVCEFDDGAGRVANWDCGDISGVQMVDIQMEVISNVALAKYIAMIMEQLDPGATERQRQRERDPMVTSGRSAGSIGALASAGPRPEFSA